MNEISRRDFVRASALAAAGLAAVACAKTAEPTTAPKAEPTATPKPAEPTATPVPAEAAASESPVLSDMVSAGTLPPLEDRLPKNPMVVTAGVLLEESDVDFEVGQFGGTLRSARVNPAWNPDVFVMNNEPLILGPGILGANAVPNLLEGFEVSNDNKTFSLYLREGLKWSDGTPVTTDDVAFAYDDVLSNETLSPSFPPWLKAGNTAKGTPVSMTVDGAYNFVMEFDEPYPGFPVQLTIVGWRGYNDLVKPKHYMSQFHADYTPLSELAPLIKEAELADGNWGPLFHAKDHTHTERTQPTSLGFPALTPWLLVEQSPAFFNYDRNPYYHKVDEEGQQLPYIDRINDKLVENNESIVLAIMAGEIDFLYEAGAMVTVPVYKENEETGGYNTVLLGSHTEPATIYINLTNEDENWRQVVRDVRFRQALNMSLNRSEIIESVWLGMGAELPTHIPSDYDPDQANALLDEIGLDQRDADGFRLGPDGETFLIPFEQSGRTPEMTPTCELVVEYFNAVGLKTTMQTIANSLRAERSAANELYATIERNQQPLWWQRGTGWYVTEWGRLWWNWHSSGGDTGEEPPPEAKEFLALTTGLLGVTEEQRAELMAESDQLLYDNLFFICPVEQERRPIIASKRMGNVAHDGFSIAACFAGEQLFYKS